MSYTKPVSVGEPGRDRGVWMCEGGRKLALEDEERREYLNRIVKGKPVDEQAKRNGSMSRRGY